MAGVAVLLAFLIRIKRFCRVALVAGFQLLVQTNIRCDQLGRQHGIDREVLASQQWCQQHSDKKAATGGCPCWAEGITAQGITAQGKTVAPATTNEGGLRH